MPNVLGFSPATLTGAPRETTSFTMFYGLEDVLHVAQVIRHYMTLYTCEGLRFSFGGGMQGVAA